MAGPHIERHDRLRGPQVSGPRLYRRDRQVSGHRLHPEHPQVSTAGIAGTVSRGTIVTISQLNGDWGYVSGGAEAKGWVALKYVSSKAGSTASATTYTVTASILNVRSGSSTRYSRIDKLYRGAEVAVTQIKGNWGKVRYSKSGKMCEGWVSLDYLKAS